MMISSKAVFHVALLTSFLCGIAQAADTTDPRFAVARNGKWGLMNRSGQLVVPAKFDSIQTVFDSEPGVARSAGLYGYIDRAGEWVIPPQYSNVGAFSEGLAPVLIGRKWGYIDIKGNIVIPPKFDAAEPFAAGVARAGNRTLFSRLESKFADVGMTIAWKTIDKNGNEVKPAPRKSTSQPNPVLERFADGMKWGLREPGTQKIVVKPAYDLILEPTEGLAVVQRGNKFGVIDLTGKTIVELKFNSISPYSHGLSEVQLNGKTGYIDHRGEWVWKPSD